MKEENGENESYVLDNLQLTSAQPTATPPTNNYQPATNVGTADSEASNKQPATNTGTAGYVKNFTFLCNKLPLFSNILATGSCPRFSNKLPRHIYLKL